MKLIVKKMSFPKGDHLWLEGTVSDEYIEDYSCHACGTKMVEFSRIQNINEVGLITGLCPKCGYTKRVRNLSPEAFSEHFSTKWLVRRDEDIKENDYVYSKVKSFVIPSGKVLDVGCGLGGSLLTFYKKGYDVYGVEPSEHRGSIGKKEMKNIEVGTAENYLANTTEKFDLIYFFDVLQFLENPYAVLESAVDKLTDGGKIWFKLGVYHRRSNFSQFAHNAMLRNYVNLYSLLGKLAEWGVYPISYQQEPIELVLSKTKGEDTDKIINSAKKLELSDIEKFASKTLKLNRMKLFGKTDLSYLGRTTILKLQKPVGDLLPVIFEHKSKDIPVLLK